MILLIGGRIILNQKLSALHFPFWELLVLTFQFQIYSLSNCQLRSYPTKDILFKLFKNILRSDLVNNHICVGSITFPIPPLTNAGAIPCLTAKVKPVAPPAIILFHISSFPNKKTSCVSSK